MRRHFVRGLARRSRLLIAVLFLLALAAAGGSSLYSEDQQMPVRLVAIVAIAATLWPLEIEVLARHKLAVMAMACLYALPLVQLIPLPPALWASLPGHRIYAQIAQETGTVAWRPLSLTPDLTLNSLLALLPATAAGLAALYLNERGRKRLVDILVLVACASALLGLLQSVSGGTSLHLYRHSNDDAPVGLFANRNHQAVLMAVALPLIGAIVGVRRRQGDNRAKLMVVSMAIVTLFLLALVSTGSRMGLGIGAIGAVAAIYCYLSANPSDARLSPRGWAATAGVSAVIVSVIGLAAARSGAIERLALTDTVTETRAAMIEPLFRTALAFMPIGSGFGSFDSVYRRFEPDRMLSTIYMNQAHNELLDLAIAGGIPALAMLALFCWWWVRATAGIVARKGPSGRRTMGLAGVAATFILMMSSLVDYPLRTPLLASIFLIACVLMLRPADERSANKARN